MFLLILLFGLPASGIAADSDADLGARLVGTWHSAFESKDADDPAYQVTSKGQDTYDADGRVHGVNVTTRAGREDRMEYAGRWEIRDGVLVVKVVVAQGGYIEAGTVTRDRILRLEGDTLVLEAADGKTLELRRGSADALP